MATSVRPRGRFCVQKYRPSGSGPCVALGFPSIDLHIGPGKNPMVRTPTMGMMLTFRLWQKAATSVLARSV